MCERPSLFLLEPKSILLDLVKRTCELLDLSLHLIEHERLNDVLSQRPSSPFAFQQSCQLKDNLQSDLERYLQRLYRSCRLTKTHLRALHAARFTRSNDYIVLDDDAVQAINAFKSKLNEVTRQSEWMEQVKKIGKKEQQFVDRRFQSQRHVHHADENDSFVFLPETKLLLVQNNSASISDDYRSIFLAFGKIAQIFRFLLEHFYGIHRVRDSHLLQPMFINIIRCLLVIADQWKQRAVR